MFRVIIMMMLTMKLIIETKMTITIIMVIVGMMMTMTVDRRLVLKSVRGALRLIGEVISARGDWERLFFHVFKCYFLKFFKWRFLVFLNGIFSLLKIGLKVVLWDWSGRWYRRVGGVSSRTQFFVMFSNVIFSVFSYASSSTLHPRERVGWWVSRSFEIA